VVKYFQHFLGGKDLKRCLGGIIRALGNGRGNIKPFSAYNASGLNLNFDMEVGIVVEQH